jgi:hypothetical protein
MRASSAHAPVNMFFHSGPLFMRPALTFLVFCSNIPAPTFQPVSIASATIYGQEWTIFVDHTGHHHNLNKTLPIHNKDRCFETFWITDALIQDYHQVAVGDSRPVKSWISSSFYCDDTTERVQCRLFEVTIIAEKFSRP